MFNPPISIECDIEDVVTEIEDDDSSSSDDD